MPAWTEWNSWVHWSHSHQWHPCDLQYLPKTVPHHQSLATQHYWLDSIADQVLTDHLGTMARMTAAAVAVFGSQVLLMGRGQRVTLTVTFRAIFCAFASGVLVYSGGNIPLCC